MNEKSYLNMEPLRFYYKDCFKQDVQYHFVSSYFDTNFPIAMHYHDFYEINIITEGKGFHYIENRVFEANAGSVFVIPPNIKHGYNTDSSLTVYHLLLSYPFLRHYKNEIESFKGYSFLFSIEPKLRLSYKEQLFFVLSKANLTEITKLMVEISKYEHSEAPHDHVLQNIKALILISDLCNFFVSSSFYSEKTSFKNSPYLILHTMEYIYSHFDEPIRIETLLKIANMSRSNFFHQFKLMCGITPNDYIINCRIEHSKELLTNTNMSITDIAQECGFFDSSHFERAFKKLSGHKSPIAYRKFEKTKKTN